MGLPKNKGLLPIKINLQQSCYFTVPLEQVKLKLKFKHALGSS